MKIFYSAGTRGFYSTDVHGSQMPGDVVEITEEQHAALMAAQAVGKLIQADGEGRPVAVDPPAAPLDEIKRRTKARIDADAEAARSAFLTPGAGQAMVYQQKADEARELLSVVAAGQTPNADLFPHLAAEVGITAPTLAGVAELVAGTEAAWRSVSAMIEGRRLAAKKAVDEAATVEEVQAIPPSIIWPAPG